MKKTIITVLCLLYFPLNGFAVDEIARIVIDTDNRKPFNDLLLGNNCLGNKVKYGNHLYGAGQWDPSLGKPNEELITLAKNAGVSILRYPGGSGANTYNWKETIGSKNHRPDYPFGLDEFMKLCGDLSATPMITLGYLASNDNDLVDLIEYLNCPDDGINVNGGIDWAKKRAENGHKDPYNVVYFELGNEIYTQKVLPEDYCDRFLRLEQLMKKISSKILIGAVTYNDDIIPYEGVKWNTVIRDTIGSKVDFYAVHEYSGFIYRKDPADLSAEKLFSYALASPDQMRYRLESLYDFFNKSRGSEIPFAINEFNCGFFQYKPVDYRHTLGSALLVADMLKTFACFDRPIICANYWHFSNNYMGMVFNNTYQQNKGVYIKRPTYYVFELYKNFQGNDLAKVIVTDSPAYTISEYLGLSSTSFDVNSLIKLRDTVIDPINVISDSGFKITSIDGAITRRDGACIEITFDGKQDVNYFNAKSLIPIKPNHKYLLTGKIKTANLSDSQGIFLEVQDSRGYRNTQWAQSTKGVNANNIWTEVGVEFKPFDENASGVWAGVRRYKNGLVSGKALIKDMILTDLGQLTEFQATKYLSVIASVNNNKKEIYLLAINKHLTKHINASIFTGSNKINKLIDIVVLNGPAIDSSNESYADVVNLREINAATVSFTNNYFNYSFEPHSVTAIKIAI